MSVGDAARAIVIVISIGESVTMIQGERREVGQNRWLLADLPHQPERVAFWRPAVLMTWDSLAWVAALMLLTVIRYDMKLTSAQWAASLIYVGGIIVIQAVLGLVTHVYLGRSRVGSFDEATSLGVIATVASVPLGLVLWAIHVDFPRAASLLLLPVALVIMGVGRWALRAVRGTSGASASNAAPVLVYGVGDAGHQVVQLVRNSMDAPYRIVGLLDDDPRKRYLRLYNHRVLGTGRDLARVAAETGATQVILAINQAPPNLIKSVSARCRAHGLQLVVLPPVREMIAGRVTLGALRHFNVADLLGRRPVETDLSEICGYINGKVVLITGAGGSIGSELAVQVHRLGPAKLILLDHDESQLHTVQLAVYGVGLLDTDDIVLVDIRDPASLNAIFEEHRPHVVFHAAALKHLPMLERFPMEGWKTNVLGSLNVLRAAHSVGAQHFVNISTDKAADASSVLGLTKRLAERLTSWFAHEYDVTYLSVRFGNVLGSRGSVLHAFRSQIDQGLPITVTHPDVTRFFMTIPEACQLVLQAGAIGRPGDVLVLDMGEPVKIADVAERLIAESGNDAVEIRYTGLRPGEKLHEVLFSQTENGTPSEHPLISQVMVAPIAPDMIPALPSSRAEVEWLAAAYESNFRPINISKALNRR